MKTMFLVAVAALLVLGGAAGAQAAGSGMRTVQAPSVAATANAGRRTQASNAPGTANPTGLPAYELRSDGLMINGLMPANGWQG